jgi:hypothetical protein
MDRESRLSLPISGESFDIMNSMRGPVIAQSNFAGVPTPCVGVCRMDEGTGLCRGCLRTLSEIAGWMAFGEDERQAVMNRIGVASTETKCGNNPTD